MSASAWIALSLLLFAAIAAFWACVSKSERYQQAWEIQAVGAAVLFALNLFVWFILVLAQDDGIPDPWETCADQGNIWYDETSSKDVCYTPEQYKIVKENE
ncbi:hypothetical protein SEA_NICEHOUSE_206 [Rhodococcus phage NiceHouse]|nr:hypothetical protein SEA_NICEHOUSE_206 [Rhodococcus phage NiceHouse]